MNDERCRDRIHSPALQGWERISHIVHDLAAELLAAERFVRERENVLFQWEKGAPELLYICRILRLLCDDPATARFRYYVTNEAPLPRTGRDVVAIQIGNEDHAIPDYVDDVLLTFTPYPAPCAPRNLLPIPLGYNGRVPELPLVPFADRALDGFFSGQSRNDRWKIARGVEAFAALAGGGEGAAARFQIEYTEGFRAGMAPDEYAQMLMSSRIAFAPRGTFSPVTFRFFEAARAGNVVISCPLPDTWYYRPFPGVRLDDWDQLPGVLERMFADRAALARMHGRMLRYYRDFCSERAVAAYMRRAIVSASRGMRRSRAAAPPKRLEEII